MPIPLSFTLLAILIILLFNAQVIFHLLCSVDEIDCTPQPSKFLPQFFHDRETTLSLTVSLSVVTWYAKFGAFVCKVLSETPPCMWDYVKTNNVCVVT